MDGKVSDIMNASVVEGEQPKKEEGKLLDEDKVKKADDTVGDGPECPQCGGTRTAHFFSRTSYGGGAQTQKDRYKCTNCGHNFWVVLKEGEQAKAPHKFLG